MVQEDMTWSGEWVGSDFSTLGFPGLSVVGVKGMKASSKKSFFARYRAEPCSMLPRPLSRTDTNSRALRLGAKEQGHGES